MAISILYEAFEVRDLAKLALTVPEEEFDTYRDWALAEYKAAEDTYHARLDSGTKADYTYRFYDSMEMEDFYLLDEQADGSMDGIMQVNELSAEKSVTQHFLHFRIFEETKGNWSIALLKDESRAFDIYGTVNYGIYKLEEEMAQGSYRQGGGRAGDDDVVAGNLLGQVGKTDGVGVHGACENLTALERAVRDRDGLGLLRGKVGCAELDHFARTHEEDALVLEAAEETKRQAHSGGRETHGVGADGGGGADFLGNREGGLEKMVEHRAQAVCVTGHLLGLLHLTDDLCFAEHHGVEAGGHSEGVLGGLFLRERIDVRLEFGAADVLAFADEAEHGVSGGVRVFGGAVDFGAVAGGQNGGFVNAAHLRAGEPLAHVADGFGDFFGTKGYALADGNRSGSMVETYSKKMHRVGDGKEERNEKVATMFNNARII